MLTDHEHTIRELSDKLIRVQQPIRILDAIKWDDSIKDAFFNKKCQALPPVSQAYYAGRALGYDPIQKAADFENLELEIAKRLGNLSPVGKLMQRMCREYRLVMRMLSARGTPEFYAMSQALYGSAHDAFYAGGPTILDLAILFKDTLPALQAHIFTDLDIKCYTSAEAVARLNAKLKPYFHRHKQDKPIVEISDQILADAAAGADVIKLRQDAMFSERDIRLLEVHEGWVHLATTLNGQSQSICTFLSKGPPSSTITQEGLAVITELFSFSAHPSRLQRITSRVMGIYMAEEGADFIDVYRYFLELGHDEDEAYALSQRIFRGSLPAEAGPFTKDLAYSKGFVQIYNYIRLAIQYGVLEQIPLLFLGKTTIEDLPLFVDLMAEGIIQKPDYVPPQFQDLAALSSWMSYSLFMNRIDLKKMANDYKSILRV